MKEKFAKIFSHKLFVICVGYAFLFSLAGFAKYMEILLVPYLISAFLFLKIEDDFYFFLYTQIFYVSPLLVRPSIVAQAIYIVILFVKFVIGCKQGKYKLHKNLLIMIAIFTGYGLIMSLFHKMAVYSLSYLIYLPFFYVIFATRKEYSVKKAFRVLAYSIVLTCVLSLITQLAPVENFDCLKHEGSSIRFKAFFGSANTLYMICLLTLCGISYLFYKHEIWFLQYIVFYIALAIITLLTLSKAGIAMLGIITLINIGLYLSIDFKRTWWHIALLCLLGATLIFVFKDFALRVIGRFAKNYDEENILNSLFTGRIDIWKDYLKAIFSNPLNFLFGHGTLSKYVYCVAQGRDRAQHNLYIFLLYKFGLFGCILLGLVIREFVIASGKEPPKFINILPLIYFLILGMCDNAFMYTHFYILVAMTLFDTKHKQNEINSNSTTITSYDTIIENSDNVIDNHKIVKSHQQK